MSRTARLAAIAGVAWIGFGLCGLTQTANAQNTRESKLQARPNNALTSSETQLDRQLPKDWGLNDQEWSRYRALMRGPLGVYSPNLDPLTALGIEARTTAERRHFAELQARAEARRAEKLLAYQRAYDEAWQRLYPSLLPLRSMQAPDASARGQRPGAQRVTIFVKEDCKPCEQRVRDLQASGQAFDLYLVGSRQDDSRIRRWATHAGVDPAKVRARTITLNHDAGLWLSAGGKGPLPAILTDGAAR